MKKKNKTQKEKTKPIKPVKKDVILKPTNIWTREENRENEIFWNEINELTKNKDIRKANQIAQDYLWRIENPTYSTFNIEQKTVIREAIKKIKQRQDELLTQIEECKKEISEADRQIGKLMTNLPEENLVEERIK